MSHRILKALYIAVWNLFPFATFPLLLDLTLTSSWEAKTLPPAAAWITARRSPVAVTTPWTASVANCRPSSGVVTASPTHPSRSPRSQPAASAVRSVPPAVTWRPS